MKDLNPRRALRPAALGTLLLASTALFTTSFAQEAATAEGSEEVTVTAQRRQETVQKVPIAVTAIGQKELESKSIAGFNDLQFNVPSVTYSNGNFGGNNFQIRGIGLSAVGTSADTGVSIHQNDIYIYSSAGLATSEYFDLERVEVLRGPQSTLYGRNATGGAVNIITAKPDSSSQYGRAEATYGSFDTAKFNAMVNIPIVENELALRIAGLYSYHDGYTENTYTGNDVGSQDLKVIRAALRWEPSSSTTIDLMGSYSFEKDSRQRYAKQLCHRDPSGVLGCLPDRLGFEPVNSNATFGTTLASQQFLGSISPLFAPLGLFDLSVGPGGNANSIVPDDNLKIHSDIDPTFRADGVFYMGSLRQDITPWLTLTALANYSDGTTKSTSHYNNLVGDDVGTKLQSALAYLAVLPGGQAYLDEYFSSPGGTGVLPISIPGSGGIGAGPVLGETVSGYSSRIQGFDQVDGSGDQATAEVRLNSNFDGPLNFLLAGFYIESQSNTRYFVNANSLDYDGIILGYLGYLGGGLQGAPTISGPTQFTSDTRLNELKSRAVFGEVYYQVTDDLKITGGLRWTNDKKQTISQATLFSTPVPFGTPFDSIDSLLLNNPAFDADPSKPGRQLVADQKADFNQVTGRFVVDWSPDLSFTDDTLVYASYSRGFKSGGINPPLSTGVGLFNVSQTFKPEQIDAYELGTKNRFLDNTLQANLTLWYYDYKGYQISQIVARTSVNDNIDATLWGIEGEFLYKPDDRWQFNLNLTNTETKIGDVAIVDQRNPGAGRNDAVVVKDLATGANCVVLMKPGANGVTPADAGVPGYFVPPGGSGSIAGSGVPHVNYGNCAAPFAADANYAYAPNPSGIPVSLKDNELPQTPKNTISFGAQYTLPFESGYEMVFRADYYWQSSMWTRIINSDPVDKIDSWDVVNVQIQVNAPEDAWFARLYATNLLDEHNLTSTYLTDASSGLFSNAFVQDPRVVGLTVGLDF